MSAAAGQGAVGRPVQVGFTLWMLIWLPVVVSTQGPQNFWWLCNLAQFILLFALWRNDRLLISSQAGTVVLVGLVWSVDFIAALVLGDSPFGITYYMFDDRLPLALRVTSTYHLWLPVFLLWLVARIGYDRRGVWLQCAIGSGAIVGGALFGDPVRNLNYVHAPFGIEQTWLPQPLWIPFLCLATALLVYLPGHWILRGWTRLRRPERQPEN